MCVTSRLLPLTSEAVLRRLKLKHTIFSPGLCTGPSFRSCVTMADLEFFDNLVATKEEPKDEAAPAAEGVGAAEVVSPAAKRRRKGLKGEANFGRWFGYKE